MPTTPPWMHPPAPRLLSKALLALVIEVFSALVFTSPPTQAKRRPRPRRYTLRSLRRLFNVALKSKTTLRQLLRQVDRRAARHDARGAFRRENTDERHPALSTPWDLPKREYPFRAVFLRKIRLLGVPAELRLVAPLATLDPVQGERLIHDRDTTLVLMVTATSRAHPLPWRTIQRFIAHLGLSVYAGGEIDRCDPNKTWCFRRRYAFLPHKGQRKATLLLEMGKRENQAGGLKLITQRP